MRQQNVTGYGLIVPNVGEISPGEQFDAPDPVPGCEPVESTGQDAPADPPQDQPAGKARVRSKETGA